MDVDRYQSSYSPPWRLSLKTGDTKQIKAIQISQQDDCCARLYRPVPKKSSNSLFHSSWRSESVPQWRLRSGIADVTPKQLRPYPVSRHLQSLSALLIGHAVNEEQQQHRYTAFAVAAQVEDEWTEMSLTIHLVRRLICIQVSIPFHARPHRIPLKMLF